MQLKPELFFYAGSNLLEGPVWSPEESAIYCVAIDQCLIYRINIATKEVKTYVTESQVGCIFIQDNEHIVAAEKNGLFNINTKTGERNFIAQIETDTKLRYNDGKLDPAGRILVGTKGYKSEYEGRACLYFFDGVSSKKIIKGATISNGLGFSNDGKTLYHIDTPTRKVAKYSYNIVTENVIFKNHCINIPDPGYPDGLCVDIDDMLWIAEWEGGRVCKWDPTTGKKLQEINLPCKRITSCCLGGENKEYLFITTAKDTDNYESLAGGLFRVKIR